MVSGCTAVANDQFVHSGNMRTNDEEFYPFTHGHSPHSHQVSTHSPGEIAQNQMTWIAFMQGAKIALELMETVYGNVVSLQFDGMNDIWGHKG
jgi:hypothetical protein